MTTNPFEPPAATTPAAPAPATPAGVWRDEQRVTVLLRGAVWPPRCAVCNRADGVQPTPMKLTLVRWWVYVTLPVVMLFVILRLVTVKRARIRPNLCTTHRLAAVVRPVAVRVGFLALAVAGLGLASVTEIQIVLLLPIVSLIAAFDAPGGLLRARAIGNEHIELAGAGPRFLASLPPVDPAEKELLSTGSDLHEDLL